MKIILTEDVVGLGDIGEIVKVKAGYARNFLIPRGVAIESETSSAKMTQHRVRQIESKKRRLKVQYQEEAKKLAAVTVVLELRVGSGGKVFGSVSAKDIVERLGEMGIELDRRRVLLSEPLKKVGTHSVKVKLHPEVTGELKVVINSLAANKEQEAQETEEARRAMELAAVERADSEDDLDYDGSEEDLLEE